ncbi:MAG: L,D-transpeptidase family protein [Vicinamibacteria bacterium]|nr:L,D-transpeptidase family protein [Vicinamibacteria bacterium]
MSRRRFFLLTGAPIVGCGTLVGSTWNSFPGAWLKNRLRLDDDKLVRARQRKRDLLARLGWPQPPARARILIRKASRRLTLYGDDREMLVCRIGLGGEPRGAKRRQGDGRTPEGDYRVCTRNAQSQFHLFLGLDYPNRRDAERGLANGMITRAIYRRIVDAHTNGRTPPWNTSLGGAVGIHGSGASWDWTLGCVALDDPDIETLWAFCPAGTSVRIEPD